MRLFTVLAYILFSVIFLSNCYAFDFSCIDNAKTIDEVDECDNQIVPRIEMSISEKFGRLGEKFENDIIMREILRLTEQSWRGYQGLLCRFEGAIVAGGPMEEAQLLEANKAYLKCLIKTMEDMDSYLIKWEQGKSAFDEKQ